MAEANLLVLRRSAIPWVGAGLLISLNTLAALIGDLGLVRASLALTGGFAIFGIGFGIWAGRKLSGQALPKPRPRPDAAAR